MRFFHSVIFGMPCGAKRIDFKRGREDRTERDVIRIGAQRGCQFLVVMGGDAERQPGIADRLQIGIDQVFLAEMQMFGAGDDRRAPVIIDHQFGRVPSVTASASVTICSACGLVQVLGAQLHGADAKRGQPRHPGDAVDDGIELIRIRVAIRIRHARTVSQ